MRLTRRMFLDTAAGLGALASLRAAPTERRLTPDEVHRELVQGNLRFASGHPRHPHASLAWVRTTAAGQHPHAVVLCCSDSRVVPEILFDVGIGDLFTVRVAGNVANEDEVASIEYAAEHLHVPLCVVLGHSNCGAVAAVVKGEAMPAELEHLVVHIREAHRRAKEKPSKAGPTDLTQATVRENVIGAMNGLIHGPKILRGPIARGDLRVEGAIYDLATGRVSWIARHNWPDN